MNPINIRFKEIRDNLKISQKMLGDKLGLSSSGISNIEKGIRSVTDKHIKLLSATCNVNEDWLFTGQGNMFIENDQTVLTELVKEYNLDDLDRNIIESYLKLNENQKSAIKTYLLNLCSNLSINNDDQSAAQEIDQEVEAYRQELEAERKGAIFSASDDIKRAK